MKETLKNDRVPVVIVILLVLAIPLFLYLINRTQETRSRAQETVTTEAESGTPDGGVQIRDDATASGGKFIQFGSTQNAN